MQIRLPVRFYRAVPTSNPEGLVEEKWTLEETLSHLSRKAGLPADAWKEGATFEIFEGQKFEERSGTKESRHGGG